MLPSVWALFEPIDIVRALLRYGPHTRWRKYQKVKNVNVKIRTGNVETSSQREHLRRARELASWPNADRHRDRAGV